MKKAIIVLSLIVMGSASVFAGPHGCPGGGGGCRPCRPCRPYHPCRPCPGYYRPGCRGWNGGCSRDLANAAAITSIVADSLSIVGSLVSPQYYSPAPVVVQQPVVVPQQPVAVSAQPVYAPNVQYYAPATPAVIYQ